MTNLISTNPAKNYKVLGEVDISTEAEIHQKITQAHKAKKMWRDLGVDGRAKVLKNLSEEIKQRKEELALLGVKEMGMPISQYRVDIDSALEYFTWYLDNTFKYLSPEVTFEDEKSIHQVFYEPLGVAAVITPWNFPVSNFVWSVIPNLIVGNTVVFKHSEECPLSGKVLEEITAHHLPGGVFNEVYGDGTVGDKLVHEDINLICFTGSTKVGRYLYGVGAEKFIRVLLELGGSAPGIVFEDADVESVLESIYSARYINSGQACDALKRLLVHENRVDEVVGKLKALLESKKIGDPEDKATDFGPLVAGRQVELLESQVLDAIDKGATVVTRGKKPQGLLGAYYEPTLLTNVTTDMRVWQEEVFGPVLPIVSFKTEEEAIHLANDTKYGLGSYVFTQDKDRADRVASLLEAGMVSVNNDYYLKPCNPFGGYKQSGLGREHGKYGMHELTQVKVVAKEK